MADELKINTLKNFTNYYKEKTIKNQIVLHTTISGNGIDGDITTFKNNTSKISTHFIIDREGNVTNIVPLEYWCNHLGIKGSFLYQQGFKDHSIRNAILNKGAIGIELDNWGPLFKQGNNKYKTIYGNIITLNDSDVIVFDQKYRGYLCYEKYKESQLDSLKKLLLKLSKDLNISVKYNKEMWDVCKSALNGDNGLFTHVSYRADKCDCHPDPNLIKTIENLTDLPTKPTTKKNKATKTLSDTEDPNLIDNMKK